MEAEEVVHGPCAVCGVPSAFTCSSCEAVWYCSTAHQRQDWKNGHKQACKAARSRKRASVRSPRHEGSPRGKHASPSRPRSESTPSRPRPASTPSRRSVVPPAASTLMSPKMSTPPRPAGPSTAAYTSTPSASARRRLTATAPAKSSPLAPRPKAAGAPTSRPPSPGAQYLARRDEERAQAMKALREGNVRAALNHGMESFKLSFEYHGGDHFDLFPDYLLLIDVHTHFHLTAEARKYLDHATDMLATHPPPDPEAFALLTDLLASMHDNMGNAREAQALHRRAAAMTGRPIPATPSKATPATSGLPLSVRVANFENRSATPDAVEWQLKLGAMLAERGDTEDALRTLSFALHLATRVHGAGTPATAAVHEALGGVYEAQDAPIDAFHAFEKAFLAYSSSLPPSAKETQGALAAVNRVLHSLNLSDYVVGGESGSASPLSWTCADVARWMKSVGLSRYEDRCLTAGVTGEDLLMFLKMPLSDTEYILQSELGVASVTDRQWLLRGFRLEMLKAGLHPPEAPSLASPYKSTKSPSSPYTLASSRRRAASTPNGRRTPSAGTPRTRSRAASALSNTRHRPESPSYNVSGLYAPPSEESSPTPDHDLNSRPTSPHIPASVWEFPEEEEDVRPADARQPAFEKLVATPAPHHTPGGHVGNGVGLHRVEDVPAKELGGGGGLGSRDSTAASSDGVGDAAAEVGGGGVDARAEGVGGSGDTEGSLHGSGTGEAKEPPLAPSPPSPVPAGGEAGGDPAATPIRTNNNHGAVGGDEFEGSHPPTPARGAPGSVNRKSIGPRSAGGRGGPAPSPPSTAETGPGGQPTSKQPPAVLGGRPRSNTGDSSGFSTATTSDDEDYFPQDAPSGGAANTVWVRGHRTSLVAGPNGLRLKTPGARLGGGPDLGAGPSTEPSTGPGRKQATGGVEPSRKEATGIVGGSATPGRKQGTGSVEPPRKEATGSVEAPHKQGTGYPEASADQKPAAPVNHHGLPAGFGGFGGGSVFDAVEDPPTPDDDGDLPHAVEGRPPHRPRRGSRPGKPGASKRAARDPGTDDASDAGSTTSARSLGGFSGYSLGAVSAKSLGVDLPPRGSPAPNKRTAGRRRSTAGADADGGRQRPTPLKSGTGLGGGALRPPPPPEEPAPQPEEAATPERKHGGGPRATGTHPDGDRVARIQAGRVQRAQAVRQAPQPQQPVQTPQPPPVDTQHPQPQQPPPSAADSTAEALWAPGPGARSARPSPKAASGHMDAPRAAADDGVQATPAAPVVPPPASADPRDRDVVSPLLDHGEGSPMVSSIERRRSRMRTNSEASEMAAALAEQWKDTDTQQGEGGEGGAPPLLYDDFVPREVGGATAGAPQQSAAAAAATRTLAGLKFSAPTGPRIKVVMLSGTELCEATATKVFCLGVVAMLAKQGKASRLAHKCAVLGMVRRAALDRRLRMRAHKTFLAGIWGYFVRRRARRRRYCKMAVVGMFLTVIRHHKEDVRRRRQQMQLDDLGADPKSRMKNMHWDVVDNVHGTIWDIDTASPELSVRPGELFHDLKQAFAARPSGATKRLALAAETPKRAKQASLLDPNQSRNMNIALARFNKVSWPDLADMIEFCDVEGIGGHDAVSGLLDLNCYDAATTRPVEMYAGSPEALDNAERFILEVVLKVPRMQQKLHCLEFTGTLSELRESTAAGLALLRTACAEVKNSRKFKELLRDVILPLGNSLNEGSKKGRAAGFKISGLAKLTQTRTNHNMTFLEYVVTRLDETTHELLTVTNDVPSMQAAMRVSLPVLHGEVTKMKNGVRRLEAEIRSGGKSQFAERMEEFLVTAGSVVSFVERELRAAVDDFGTLCRFLGEDPASCAVEDIFGLLHAFFKSFDETIAKVRAERDRKEREQKREDERKKLLARRGASGKPAVSDREAKLVSMQTQRSQGDEASAVANVRNELAGVLGRRVKPGTPTTPKSPTVPSPATPPAAATPTRTPSSSKREPSLQAVPEEASAPSATPEDDDDELPSPPPGPPPADYHDSSFSDASPPPVPIRARGALRPSRAAPSAPTAPSQSQALWDGLRAANEALE